MAEEKFISIDYNTWNTKYKHMEKELEETKRKLEAEIKNKTGELRLRIDKLPIGRYINNTYIGTVDFSLDIPLVTIEDRKTIVNAIRNSFNNAENTNWRGESIKWTSTEEAFDIIKQMGNRLDELNKKRVEIKDKLEKIPKFIKWLFKIKL